MLHLCNAAGKQFSSRNNAVQILSDEHMSDTIVPHPQQTPPIESFLKSLEGNIWSLKLVKRKHYLCNDGENIPSRAPRGYVCTQRWLQAISGLFYFIRDYFY